MAPADRQPLPAPGASVDDSKRSRTFAYNQPLSSGDVTSPSSLIWRGGPKQGPPLARLVAKALRALVDDRILCRVGVRNRVVGQHVGGDGRVHRDGDVGVDERHLLAFADLLAALLLQLLLAQAFGLWLLFGTHPKAPFDGSVALIDVDVLLGV